MYLPPPTNAQNINPYTGALSPITSVGALMLFSSQADCAQILPLLQALDPAAVLFDGLGLFCPPVLYGSDGRTINAVSFSMTVAGQPLVCRTAVGTIIAQRYYGPGWNGMRQPGPGGVYNTLFFDSLNDGADAQLDWGYVAPKTA